MPDLELHPIIKDFKTAVEKNATLHMQYSQMFTEVTQSQTPTEKPQVKNYDQMFRLVNFIMTKWAPYYNEYGLVGFPINAIIIIIIIIIRLYSTEMVNMTKKRDSKYTDMC